MRSLIRAASLGCLLVFWAIGAKAQTGITLGTPTAVTGASDPTYSEACPSWSPDDKWLVFCSNQYGNNDIFKVEVSSGVVTRLTTNSAPESFPSWSPDGQKILFQRGIGSTSEIWVMNQDGTGQLRLTSGYRDGEASFSPDGSKILFAGWRPPTSDYGIFMMNPDGSAITWLNVLGAHPKWSRDGSRIAFERYYQYGVWVMNADGTGLHLCSPRTYNSNDGGGGIDWAPSDCGYLVYTVNSSFAPPATNCGLAVINSISCSGQNQILPFESGCQLPAWSHDGANLAYHKFDGSQNDIFMAEITGCIAGGPSKVVINSIRAYSNAFDGKIYTGVDNYIDIEFENVGEAWQGRYVDIYYWMSDRCWVGENNSFNCPSTNPIGYQVDWGSGVFANVYLPDIPANGKYILQGQRLWFSRQWIDRIELLPRSADGAPWDGSGHEPNIANFTVEVLANPMACEHCLSEWASVASAFPITKVFGEGYRSLQCMKEFFIGTSQIAGGLSLAAVGAQSNNNDRFTNGITNVFMGLLNKYKFAVECAGKPVTALVAGVVGVAASLVDICIKEFSPNGGGGCGTCFSDGLIDAKHAAEQAFEDLLDEVSRLCETNQYCRSILLLRCPVDATIISSRGDSASVLDDGSVFRYSDSIIADAISDGMIFVVPSEISHELTIRGIGIGVLHLTWWKPTSSGTMVKYNFENLAVGQGILFQLNGINSQNGSPVLACDSSGDGVFDYLIMPTSSSDSCDIEVMVTDISGNGLSGMQVDLLNAAGTRVTSGVTNQNGAAHFPGLPFGGYTVSVLVPLGYGADYDAQAVIAEDKLANSSFIFNALDIIPNQKPRSYWVTQIQKALAGTPRDYTLGDFSGFAAQVNRHFNENRVNQVDFYVVPQPATQTDSLELLRQILTMTVPNSTEPFLKKYANAELMAVMLNVIAGKISQTQVISLDDRTVSQAITYCDYLINGIPSEMAEYIELGSDSLWPHRRAQSVAYSINTGQMVSAGKIPAEVADIAYRSEIRQPIASLPTEFELKPNHPNPFNPSTTIEFAIPTASDVQIEVYNIAGQKIATLVNSRLEAGNHSITWDSRSTDGEPLASGIYLYRLKAGDFVETRKMMLLK
ncbi:MAG: PD40 domain-containing protein [bacterium]|jgi:hypothetical protein